MDNLLKEFLASMIGERVSYFPIRHHSPACAWHVRELIRQERPAVVLIEGPADLTELIPLILHEQTKTPFAVYLTYIDNQRLLDSPPANLTAGLTDTGPQRFNGYFPFCDYSPELVALQTGTEVGAKVRFIDLKFPDHILADQTRDGKLQRFSLLNESHLQNSRYINALARQAGCRDQNELWDHLFEANFLTLKSTDFISNVAAYCAIARINTSSQQLMIDGTVAREQAMTDAICQELQAQSGRLLVITGGFHTAVLPQMVKAQQASSTSTSTSKTSAGYQAGDAQTLLISYSYDQLDALNGYASGMPSPDYYQRLWSKLDHSEPFLKVAGEILIEVGRLMRARGNSAISIADEIAALEQTRRLAAFRGHAGPLREDLLDGIRSAFIKGASDSDGSMLLEIVKKLLAGNRVGAIPSEAGQPPIVGDFRRLAALLRLKIDDSEQKQLHLDIYRKAQHRKISRFLHSLNFIKVPFALQRSGPDFVNGRGLDRIQENWDYRWYPQTESMLIEQSLYGATIEEAAINCLKAAIIELAAEGQARSASAAVRMLVAACRMGLHKHTDEILKLIEESITEDPTFISIVSAMQQLSLLWQSREPLEAHKLKVVPSLAVAAYRKACYLIPSLGQTAEADADELLTGICTLRELLLSDGNEQFDVELCYQALQQIVADAQAEPIIAGAAVGTLFNAGWLLEARLLEITAGYLDSHFNQQAIGASFLRGLLAVSRESLWNVVTLIELIDARLRRWPEDDFLKILPDLRLAFSDLTPRETDRVAAQVAAYHGKSDLGELTIREFTEADAMLGFQLDKRMAEILLRDNLSGWIKER